MEKKNDSVPQLLSRNLSSPPTCCGAPTCGFAFLNDAQSSSLKQSASVHQGRAEEETQTGDFREENQKKSETEPPRSIKQPHFSAAVCDKILGSKYKIH